MLEKIRQIKYSRLSDEERFFLETIDGIEPFKSDKYPQSIFWKKNDTILLDMDYKLGCLRVNYKLIWSVFENKYGYDYNDIQSFVEDMVDRHIKLESIAPILYVEHDRYLVDRHTKLRSLPGFFVQ